MGLNNFTGNSGGNANGGMPPFQMVPAGNPGGGNQTDVTDMLINYNDKFKTGAEAMFRESVIEQTLAVLIGKNKPNALLIGAAGTGKTKIVEDIACKLANDDSIIPDKLKGYTVWELPLSNIVAGSGIVGEVEEKIQAVIEFAENPKNKVILFIDEIHQLADYHGSSYSKIAQILKPALSRGRIRTIGATTTQEAGDLTDDPAFNRRFSRLIVDELTKEQTLEVLKNAVPGFLMHYKNKVAIDQNTLETVCQLADEYRPAGSHRPDNAITLLDRAAGDSIVNRKIMEKNAAGDAALLAAIKSVPIIPVTERQIKTTAKRLATGNSKADTLDLEKMKASLSRIKGQDDAIEEMLHQLRRRDLRLFPDKKTPLTMLLIGPSGVGKTEITKTIADELTGVPPIILNMTEYHSPASINRIIGSPAGYVGSDSHNELPFDGLETNPYQVVLLDEFEKCDRSVQTLFMSAFDEGYIKTNKGKVIDFSKTIIIATSNATQTTIQKSIGFVQGDSKATVDIKALEGVFDPALLNRFEDRIAFQPISKDVYREILKDRYERQIAKIRDNKPRIKLVDEIPDEDLDKIIKDTYVEDFGARPAVRAVQEYIENQLL